MPAMDRFRRVQSKQSIRSRSNSCERLFVNRVLTLRVLGCLSLFFLWLWTATILWLTRHNTHSHSSHHTLFSALSPPRQPQPHLHLRSSSTAPFKSFALREKEWKRRTEELQARREHGEDLNDEENFLLEFSHLALTKSMLQGAVAPDRCSFPGPRPRTLPAAVTTGLVEQVAPLVGTSSAALGEYLERRKAQLLPLSHEFCTNEHAEVFPAVRREEGLFGGKAGPAAYVFKEVCTTFNVDSVKRAQRTVVVVDNTNAHPQRCSPCPNPQMNKVWGWNECGIMWLHQMNVQSLADFNTCYKSNRDLIRRHGQRQEPGETPLNSAVYYGGTTLLVQFVQINPGHQLWDFLFSLFPVLIAMDFQTPFFDHVIVQQAPDCPDNLWSCRILRRLGVFRSKEPQRGENLVKEFTGVLPCFERLIAPVPGWNHRNERYNAKALQLVREKVQEAFELATKYKKEQRSRAELKNLYEKLVSGEAVDLKLLLYPHSTKGEAGKRRAWLDVDEAHDVLAKQGLKVDIVRDFAKVSVDDQARMFYEADILVMSHGGQMGNSIFSNANTFVVEVNCGGYSHMGLGNTYITGLGFLHVNYRPCGCPSNPNDRDNYRLPVVELFNVLRVFSRDAGSFAQGSRQLSCAQ